MLPPVDASAVAVPRVAVLLAAHNGLAHLPQQVTSILDQAGVAIQLFVSVDASTDGTEEWVAALARSESRVTLLPTGQRFGGAAPNFFRLLSEVAVDAFDAVAFADQDDLWHTDKLQRAVQAIQTRGVAGYSSNVTAFWPDGREQLVRKSRPQRRWDFLFEAAGPGCTYVMTRELACLVRQRLLTDPDARCRIVYHDWFVYALARCRDLAWFIDPMPGMRYRQHASNQLGVNAGLRSAWARMCLVFNGWAFEQTLLIACLAGMDSHEPVLRDLNGGRLGLLRLMLRARQCRRAPRDQWAFAAACLWLALSPRRLSTPRAEKAGA